MNNRVTRWGNKSETFIFLLLQYSLDFMYIAAQSTEQEKERKR